MLKKECRSGMPVRFDNQYGERVLGFIVSVGDIGCKVKTAAGTEFERSFGNLAQPVQKYDPAADAHKIILAINEFFRHNNPVDPSMKVMDDDRTIKEWVEDYLAKAKGAS